MPSLWRRQPRSIGRAVARQHGSDGRWRLWSQVLACSAPIAGSVVLQSWQHEAGPAGGVSAAALVSSVSWRRTRARRCWAPCGTSWRSRLLCRRAGQPSRRATMASTAVDMFASGVRPCRALGCHVSERREPVDERVVRSTAPMAAASCAAARGPCSRCLTFGADLLLDAGVGLFDRDVEFVEPVREGADACDALRCAASICGLAGLRSAIRDPRTSLSMRRPQRVGVGVAGVHSGARLAQLA